MSRGSNGRPRKKRPAESQRAKTDPVAEWPLAECVVNADWRDTHSASVYLLKHHRQVNDYLFAGFLIDLWGFGLKDAFTRSHVSRRFLAQATTRQMESDAATASVVHVTACAENLARQLIYGGILWARRHQFRTPEEYIGVTTAVLGPLPADGAVDLSVLARTGSLSSSPIRKRSHNSCLPLAEVEPGAPRALGVPTRTVRALPDVGRTLSPGERVRAPERRDTVPFADSGTNLFGWAIAIFL